MSCRVTVNRPLPGSGSESLAERLAVAAVRQMRGTGGAGIEDALVPIVFSSLYQPVADAIRAALDEAATVARDMSACRCGTDAAMAADPERASVVRVDLVCPRCDRDEDHPTPHMIAAAIEALK